MWQCDKIKELADKWLSDDAAGYDVLASLDLDGIEEIITAVRN